MTMLRLGMHVDNWRHSDVSYEVPCQFASDHKLKFVEFGTIDGDYFVQALGYNPHICLHSDPLELRAYLDGLGLKVSQLDAAYPMSSPLGQSRGPVHEARREHVEDHLAILPEMPPLVPGANLDDDVYDDIGRAVRAIAQDYVRAYSSAQQAGGNLPVDLVFASHIPKARCLNSGKRE